MFHPGFYSCQQRLSWRFTVVIVVVVAFAVAFVGVGVVIVVDGVIVVWLWCACGESTSQDGLLFICVLVLICVASLFWYLTVFLDYRLFDAAGGGSVVKRVIGPLLNVGNASILLHGNFRASCRLKRLP